MQRSDWIPSSMLYAHARDWLDFARTPGISDALLHRAYEAAKVLQCDARARWEIEHAR